jgi:hypothetical protein
MRVIKEPAPIGLFTILLALGLLALGCASGGPSTSPTPAAGETRPYQGKPWPIPGTIEAENFDLGEDGVAFKDADPQNQGEPYRQTSVDTEKRPDASGGFGVGWTKAGEWLVYSVEVKAPGLYTIEIPVASNGKGGTFHIEFDGKDKTGPIEVPSTGSWQTLKVISKPGIKLDAGVQKMRLVMDTEGETKSVGDMDFIRIRS